MVLGSAAKMQMEGKINLKEEQEILMNISDMMIAAFNAESLLLRVQKLENHSAKKVDQEIYEAILKTYLHSANNQINQFGTAALAGFIPEAMLGMTLKGLRQFTKYPPQNVIGLRRKVAAAVIEADAYCL